MKNGKLFTTGLVTSLVAVLALGYFLFARNTEVQATGILFEGETYSITLKQPITAKSLTDGSIAAVDEKGENAKAKFSVDKAGTALTISGLSVGKYTLQIKQTAYKKNAKSQQEQPVALEVVRKVEKLTSTEDLKDYFRAFVAQDNARSNRFNDMAQEESAMSMENKDSGSGGPSYSTTNNQVEGIEEGDITITDGRSIYTIVDNKVVIVDAKTMQVVKRLTIGKEIYPSHLMLHEKTLIVGYTAYVQTLT